MEASRQIPVPAEALLDVGAVLPEQVVGGQRHDAGVSGELALRLALLEDAIRCLAVGSRPRSAAERRLAREAEAWIRNLDKRWPFSFGNVCEALAIDAPSLRRKLLELRYPAMIRQPASPAPASPPAGIPALLLHRAS